MKENLELIFSKGSICRTKDLNEVGISNYLISKMIGEGFLTKIYQGVYAIEDIKTIKLTDINIIVENGIISLVSAACYYQLTTGEFVKCTITLDRDQKPPRIPYDLFMYFYTTSSLYDVGLNIINEGGRKIKIYDVERTVCDILKHRSKYDNELVNEIFINYLKRKDCDVEKLLLYSKELRVHAIVVRYLEIFGGYNG